MEGKIACSACESGASATCESYRTQLENKKEAFKRLVKTDTFKKWHRMKTNFVLQGRVDIQQWLDQQMHEDNLKVEYL
jgi:hypothetical protein